MTNWTPTQLSKLKSAGFHVAGTFVELAREVDVSNMIYDYVFKESEASFTACVNYKKHSEIGCVWEEDTVVFSSFEDLIIHLMATKDNIL